MTNSKNLRFECIRCGNCCTDKNTLVNLTYYDILRIKNGLDLNIQEILDSIGFYISKEKVSAENLHKMVIAPIETEKGLAFIGLLKNEKGYCHFYDEQKRKCLIYNLRPLFCRTFPFSFTFDRNNIDIIYTKKGLEYCSGISEEASFINLDYWIKLAKKVFNKLNKNNEIIKIWNDNIAKNKKIPSVKNFIKLVLSLDKA